LTKIIQSNKAVFFILLLLAVFMHFEKVAFWDWSYVKLSDEGNNVLPYHLTDAASFADKITSFWQPKYAAGVDLLATGTRTGLESILFSLLPTWLAYGFYKILIFLIGGFFVFKLLRDRLKTEYIPALLAGVAFIFFKPDELWDKMSVLALPAVVYAISWRAALKSGGLLFAFATGIIYQLGAQITLSLTLLSTVFLWLFFIERIGLKRSAALFLSFAAGVLAVEPHAIWAFMANGGLSHRSHFEVAAPQYARFFKEWAVAVINGAALLLVIAGLIARGRIGQNVTIFLIAAMIALYQPVFEVLRFVLQDISPLIGGYSIPKGLDASIWFALSAGLSLDLILRHDVSFRVFRRARKFSVAATVSLGIVLVIAGGILIDKMGRLWDMLYDENFAAMYRHPDLLELAAEKKDAPPFRVATPFVLSDTGYIVPTFVWAYGFETVDGYVSMYPKRYKEYWLRVLAAQKGTERYKQFQGANSMIYLFGNPTDRGPACPDGGMSCPVDFEKDYDLELLSLANVRYVISARKLISPHFKLLPSTTRAALALTQQKRLRQRLSAKLAGDYVGPPLYIYENKMAFPRYFLTDSVRIFNSKEKLLPALSDAGAEGLRRTAFVRLDDANDAKLTRDLTDLKAAQAGGGAVEIIRHERDEIVLRLKTERPRVLVAANNFSPFWKADLNGRPLTVFPVYNTFQGVLVPEGLHTLRLRYLPPYSPKTYLP